MNNDAKTPGRGEVWIGAVGRTFEAGAPFVVTAERIASFCGVVGDRNPLYVDPEAAKAVR